ncbi:uncharacterized protein LOC119561859 [Drosophila subpulchrella]|uniref:uncharacterized protein LOC119561859 n=1 Tax=Drosophila subpulchrella TaxID=1486046 RepID=UPI0018A18A04|nr:uncharacterized protein LOC119561859 [Drosophila subpulchrella]
MYAREDAGIIFPYLLKLFALPSVLSTISSRYVPFKSCAKLPQCYDNLPACLLSYCFGAQRPAKTSHIRSRQMYARGDAGIIFPYLLKLTILLYPLHVEYKGILDSSLSSPSVTTTYQLAYCHTVLERNDRRKLATVYGHDKCMPEETLESFFLIC